VYKTYLTCEITLRVAQIVNTLYEDENKTIIIIIKATPTPSVLAVTMMTMMVMTVTRTTDFNPKKQVCCTTK
jgi:hypothetical protein